MIELEKEIISEKVWKLTDGMTDEQLKYAIEIMQFWLNERKRQDIEIIESGEN